MTALNSGQSTQLRTKMALILNDLTQCGVWIFILFYFKSHEVHRLHFFETLTFPVSFFLSRDNFVFLHKVMIHFVQLGKEPQGRNLSPSFGASVKCKMEKKSNGQSKTIQTHAVFHLTKAKGCPGFKEVNLQPSCPSCIQRGSRCWLPGQLVNMQTLI